MVQTTYTVEVVEILFLNFFVDFIGLYYQILLQFDGNKGIHTSSMKVQVIALEQLILLFSSRFTCFYLLSVPMSSWRRYSLLQRRCAYQNQNRITCNTYFLFLITSRGTIFNIFILSLLKPMLDYQCEWDDLLGEKWNETLQYERNRIVKYNISAMQTGKSNVNK